jgi:hypothetical protein
MHNLDLSEAHNEGRLLGSQQKAKGASQTRPLLTIDARQKLLLTPATRVRFHIGSAVVPSTFHKRAFLFFSSRCARLTPACL